MSIAFLYKFDLQHLTLGFFSDIILILAYLMVIKSSKKQYRDAPRGYLLKLIGFINIAIIIVLRFLPVATLQDFNFFEFQMFKLYKLSKSMIVLISSLVTLGVFLFLFGRSNDKKYLAMSGLLMILTSMMNILTTLMYFGALIDEKFLLSGTGTHQGVIWAGYILLTNFSTTSYILALSVFIVHCQLNKDTHLLYAVLAIISQQVGAEVLRWLVSIF